MAEGFDPYHQWLGIPPKHQPPTHYRLLAIEEFEDDPTVIENAADRQMAHVRTFQTGKNADLSQKLLNEISAAKVCLLNPTKKAEYDAQLRADREVEEAPARPPQPRVVRGEHAAPPPPVTSPVSQPTSGIPSMQDMPQDIGPSGFVPASREGWPSRRRRFPLWAQASLAGTLLGIVIIAVLFIDFRGDHPRVAGKPGIEKEAEKKDAKQKTKEVEKKEKKAEVPPPKKEPPVKRTNPVSPSAPPHSSGGVVYLDDLQEKESKVGHGTFGKHGQRGYSYGPAKNMCYFKGNLIPHALSMAPGTNRPSYVVYELNGAFSSFRGTAGILDMPTHAKTHTPLTFKIIADEKLLWQSDPIQKTGTGQDFAVNVGGVQTLRLEVDCPGSNRAAHAAWILPRLSRASTPPLSEVVYLDDLQENDFKVGLGTLGKHGQRGFPYPATKGLCYFRGKRLTHALSMPPNSKNSAYVVYELNGAFSSFRGTAGVLDMPSHEKTASPLTFKIFADERLLWQSQPIQKTGTGEEFTVSIRGVQTLKLEVVCPGFSGAAHAAWILPQLVGSAPPPSGVVYLDDLQEKEFQVSLGTVGKHGRLGGRYPKTEELCYFQGKRLSQALAFLMGARSNKPAYVVYELNGAFHWFRGTAGLLDLASAKESTTPLAFKIFADDKLLWESDPLQKIGTGQEFDVDVRGVQTLKLYVRRSGSPLNVHAAWIDPRLGRGDADPVAKRLPVPEDNQLAEALRQVKEAFQEDYAAVKTGGQKAALAGKLLKYGTEKAKEPADVYVYLGEARDLAAEGGDAEVAFGAIDELARRFDVDAVTMKLAAAKMLVKATMPSAERKELAQTLMDLSSETVEEHRYDVAAELADLAWNAASKSRDVEMRRIALAWRKDIGQLKTWWDEAQAARKTLEQTPDDPAANAALGKYLCFAEENWEEGLPHLAKGGEAGLQQVAKLELAAPTAADAQVGLGDAWWTLASKAPAEEKVPCQLRAGFWYRKAVGGLVGLAKTRVEQRIEELDKVAATAPKRKTKTKKAANLGMIGRCKVNRQDVGLLMTYQPGQHLTHQTLTGQVAAAATGLVEVDMLGILRVPKKMTLRVEHAGGSSSGGRVKLYLNGQLRSTLGDDLKKSETYQFANFPAGNHAIRWVITGGNIGRCRLQFSDDATGTALPVGFSKALLQAASQLPTRKKVDVSSP